MDLARRDPSQFEMVVNAGDKAFFVRGSPKGLVLGPKNQARDDHITVGFDGGEISQIHRKVNGYEEWRVTPEAFQAEVDSLVANHLRTMEFADVSNPTVRIISTRRIRVLFAVPQALATVAMPLLWRLVATKRVVGAGANKTFEVSIEQVKLRNLAARSSGPLSVLERLLGHLPPKVPVQVLKRVGRWACVRPRTPDELDGDLFFVVSKDYVGLLWRSEVVGLQYLPIGPLVNLYLRAERGLPFGKLDELGRGWTGGVALVGRSW